MRKTFIAVLGIVATLAAAPFAGRANTSEEYSVEVSATVQSAPAQITLTWPQDKLSTPKTYTVYRRAPGASSWGTGITLPGAATSYTDRHVTVGAPYDYQIVKTAADYNGYGYIYAGINVPLTENRGRLLLVVDNTCARQLKNELSRLNQDLVGDGWTVTRIDVSRGDSSVHVKDLIKAQYAADPAHVKAVFLFGHVPVPYSGDIAPDGHYANHQGAWPCDGYYGDMNGRWTDHNVKDTTADDARNHNVPGDGKFDQSQFPAPLTLMVGRVDLSDMPGRLRAGGPATFPSELELLRNYLNKDHEFRNKIFSAPDRAIVGDYFGVRDGEAFAASGWRNFAPFFGAAGISTPKTKGSWISILHTNACLWAYGCGNGSYTSVEGLGRVGEYKDGVTTELVDSDVKAVFVLLYGSWLGDWDSEDNIQRGVLATKDFGLTCAWSGRPHWFMQHMALGKPIGYSTLVTQNDGFSGLYRNQENNCASWTHIALMGDPTLRMQVVAPVAGVTATATGRNVNLNWMESADANAGYNIYRATNPNGPFTRVNASPVKNTSFTDAKAARGNYTYMVRAVRLEKSASGTYFNASEGAFATAGNAANSTVAAHVSPSAPNSTADSTGAREATRPAERKLSPTGATSGSGATDTVWFDDSLPAGAQSGADGGDSWNWVSSNPTPFSGTAAHQSNIAAGEHQHYFAWAWGNPLPVNTGEVLYAYIYLDPANPPSEVMLSWFDNSWTHNAYWGANNLNYGTDGTASRQYMGALPAAGGWTRLEVPANRVGLEGSSLTGMSFVLYGGRATWDDAGKSTALSTVTSTNSTSTDTNSTGTSTNSTSTDTNSVAGATNPPPTTSYSPLAASNFPLDGTNFLPGLSIVDDVALAMPKPGDTGMHILTPTLLELDLVNTKLPDPVTVTNWNLVNSGQFLPPSLGEFTVTVNGQPVTVSAVGFKRRPLYAPLGYNDLRIGNSLYLQLATPISSGQTVQVQNPDHTLWGANAQFTATADPLRFSPAIHVNEEGYIPNRQKTAMVGYYLGSMGEMSVSATTFAIVDTNGTQVFQGNLTARPDFGWVTTPTPYQQVYQADFTGFNTPGTYRVQVPGMGASLPFVISDSIAMDFARTYALGLYHQRCGTNNVLPYTRFTHDDCHDAPASVPVPASNYAFTWTTISNYAIGINSANPPQTAPFLTSPSASLFPYQRTGQIDVSGGHHDAGDYSKYTLNSGALIHTLMFAVDSLPGVSNLDNLGIPESGDGIPDMLQEAKWEADYIAKLQDTDGGFYFIVYPMNREYESDVTPDHGDPQVVWPKNSSATACAVAALAECASSPLMKKYYPQAAASYMTKAMLGWQFLTNAIAKYGKSGIYQKITFYGDDFTDKDELAWAACEMYLATGNPQIQQTLFSWFPDPTDPATFEWGWWSMYSSYGNAVRSYAFAAKSGRLPASALDPAYLGKCITTLTNRANDLMTWSRESAYGTSFPLNTKHMNSAGWYFSSEQCYDIAAAYQFNPDTNYLNTIVENMNYEGGCNPVNISYITGLGWKRQRDVVSQYALNDRRMSPPTGEPVGNLQTAFSSLWFYPNSEVENLVYPSDGASTSEYPFYDRWGDSWNVTTEFVTFQSARSLATYAFLAAQTQYQTQAWHSVSASITPSASGTLPIGTPATMTLQAPGVDLTGARVTWEIQNQEPVMTIGANYTFTPQNNGNQWIEAEAQLMDGRRVFAAGAFNADTTNFVWVDDAVPAGGTLGSDGGDSWNWVGTTGNVQPVSGALIQQSAIASGEHQHFFYNATKAMSVATGDVLYASVYLDPANPPSEVMISWNDGSWSHAAYWGANSISYGTDGTASRRYMGPLPALGKWVQLQVPSSQVAMDGSVANGMAFDIYNGRAWWDCAGVLNPNISTGANSGGGTNTNTTPAVAVTATDASRVGPTTGGFTFTRSGGDTNSALTVNYSLGGTAVPGTDYQVPQALAAQLSGASPSVTIPAGATSTTLNITPVPTTNLAGSATVELTLSTNGTYSVSPPPDAKVTIAGNAVNTPSLKFGASPGSGPTLSWTSTNGAIYRIAYKDNLSDPSWTYTTNNLTANGTNMTWSDTSATNRPHRFYSIVRVQ